MLNNSVKYWRHQAHKYFDIIWMEGHVERDLLYGHLADYLKLSKEECHIKLFDVEKCKEVIDWSKRILNDLRRLDMDFGIEVKRKHYCLETA